MHSARIISADGEPNMPHQDVGAEPVILVTTDRGRGRDNAFYIDPVDRAGRPIKLPLANQPVGAPLDPDAMNFDDPIDFDIADGLFHKKARWNGREIRQRGDSFDFLDPLHQGTG